MFKCLGFSVTDGHVSPIQAVPVSSTMLHGTEAGPTGDGGYRSQLACVLQYSEPEREMPDMPEP